jgi:probable phosphoglycerate mutase
MRRAWVLLGNQSPSAVYSSPSRRAVESSALRPTATPLVTVDERLREIDFGALEGLTYDDIAARYPHTYAEWMTRPADVVFPEGESFARMSARVREALEEMRQKHCGQTVVAVSHGGVNRIALADALELDRRRTFSVAQAYACVNVIDYGGGQPVVIVMNVSVQPC